VNVPIEHQHAAGGSPLYQVSPEHLAAVFALGVLLVGAWLLLRRGAPNFVPSLAPADWLLAGLLAGSAAIHAGLAIGHDDHAAGLRALFLVDAALLGVIARRVLLSARAGRLGVVVLASSIGAFWVSVLGGEAPDQVGLVTKLGEIAALAIVLRPAPGRRWNALRSVAGSVAIGLLVVVTATSSWIGAFRASAAEPGAVAGHHVHAGSVAPPGTILPVVPEREPTPAERAAAAELVLAARYALARYADPAVAAADGYGVNGLAGIDFHAANPAHENDDRVLMGAMFLMPKIGTPGPTIGGPLTVWHAHQHVCFSLTPPALAGLLSPLGMCPLGTIDLPLTAEMIHIWIVPGAPEPFGDLDEAWKRAYLEATATRP
jgi:hypothetical protein